MLLDVNGKKKVKIPHEKDFKIWKSRLTEVEINHINDAIDERVEGKEVNVASWIPGNQWEGTPFNAIYEKACHKNKDLSGKCFGLFVWEYMINDSETWYFTKQPMKENGLDSMIYFKGNK